MDELILTFNANDNSQVVFVNITDDLIAESDEMFEVFLKLIPDSPNVILGNPSVATGIILDNEIPSKIFIHNYIIITNTYLLISCCFRRSIVG